MTAVYIGNATQQILQFTYRLPERRAITQPVPVYQQVKLSPDFSHPDIESLLGQWGKYGLVDATEMQSVAKDFEGYLISIGKPIPSDKLVEAVNMRDSVLIERGRILRQDAAVAMINTIENETGTVARSYEISVSEEEPRKGFSNPHDRHVAEGFRADRTSRPDMPEHLRGG